MREWWSRCREEALQRDMLPSWYSTRGRRRALAVAGVVAMALIWAGAVVSWNLAPGDTAMYWTIGMLAGSVVIGLPVISLLNVATRGTTSLAEDKLDERQVAERLRAHTVAHRVMFWLLVLVAVVVFSTSGGREAHVPMAAVVVIVLALLLTHMLMPLLAAGWRAPDPPPDDEEDDEAGR